MGDTTYKVHLNGYNNLGLWTGKTEKSARREILYYDETDLMAICVDGWKMHIGVKMHNNWFDPKSYHSVPYVVNLLMDPMEKMTPDSDEYDYIGRVFFAHKLWAPTVAGAISRGPSQESPGPFPQPGCPDTPEHEESYR